MRVAIPQPQARSSRSKTLRRQSWPQFRRPSRSSAARLSRRLCQPQATSATVAPAITVTSTTAGRRVRWPIDRHPRLHGDRRLWQHVDREPGRHDRGHDCAGHGGCPCGRHDRVRHCRAYGSANRQRRLRRGTCSHSGEHDRRWRVRRGVHRDPRLHGHRRLRQYIDREPGRHDRGHDCASHGRQFRRPSRSSAARLSLRLCQPPATSAMRHL